MLEEHKFEPCIVQLCLLQAVTFKSCDLQMHYNNLHLNLGKSETASKVWSLRVFSLLLTQKIKVSCCQEKNFSILCFSPKVRIQWTWALQRVWWTVNNNRHLIIDQVHTLSYSFGCKNQITSTGSQNGDSITGWQGSQLSIDHSHNVHFSLVSCLELEAQYCNNYYVPSCKSHDCLTISNKLLLFQNFSSECQLKRHWRK